MTDTPLGTDTTAQTTTQTTQATTSAAPTLPDNFDFKSILPDDIKGHTSIGKLNLTGKDGLVGFAKSYIHAQSMIGGDPNRMVQIPEKIDAATRKDILKRMGLPADQSGYKLEPLPDAVPWLSPDEPLAKGLVAKAAEFGMFPDQVQGLYGWFAGEMTKAAKEQHATQTKADADNIEGLRKEWGDAYDSNVRAANHAINKLGGDDLRNAINDAGLGAHPAVVKALATVGKMFAEAGSGGDKGQGAGFASALTPAEASAKAKELLAAAMDEKNQFKRRQLHEEAQKYFTMAVGKGVVK